jgi:hypothetical protein
VLGCVTSTFCQELMFGNYESDVACMADFDSEAGVLLQNRNISHRCDDYSVSSLTWMLPNPQI